MKFKLTYSLILPSAVLVGCFGGGGGNSPLPGGGSTTSPSLSALKITSVAPTTANAGDTITISGEGFPTTGLSIKVGNTDCTNIVVSSTTSATCQVGKNGGLSTITISTADESTSLANAFTQSFRTTFLNKPSNAGLNISSTQATYGNSLLYHDGKLYAAWAETTSTVTSVRVAVNDGTDNAPSWTSIDGGETGIRINPANAAANNKLFVFQNKVHIIWNERNVSNSDALRIKRYEGNSTWTTIDVGATTGLNFSSTAHASVAKCAEALNKLYCVWTESSKIRMKVYDGTTWDTNDGGGLNRDLSRSASMVNIISYNDKLYITWVEQNASSVNQVRARSFVPATSTWHKLDSDQESGLNNDATKNSIWPTMAVFANKFYFAWSEIHPTTAKNHVRVIYFNGNDTSPGFTRIDGGGVDGLAADASSNGTQATLGMLNSQLVVFYIDYGNSKVRAAYWGGNATLASWTHITGSAANTLNYDATKSINAGNPISGMVTAPTHTYGGWPEISAGGTLHFRVMKLD